MPDDLLSFQSFLNSKIKERNISLKKLSELSGITVGHLEHLMHGDYAKLPATPYVRGYLQKLADLLDFDFVFWWDRLQQEARIAASGATDALPENRFALRSHAGIIALVILGVVVVLYLALRLPAILGRPELTVTDPATPAVTVSSDTYVVRGTAENADEVTINGETVTVNEDGSWSRTVALQAGPNPIEVRAAKLLGREDSVTLQIFYNPAALPTEPNPSATTTSPNATSSFE